MYCSKINYKWLKFLKISAFWIRNKHCNKFSNSSRYNDSLRTHRDSSVPCNTKPTRHDPWTGTPTTTTYSWTRPGRSGSPSARRRSAPAGYRTLNTKNTWEKYSSKGEADVKLLSDPSGHARKRESSMHDEICQKVLWSGGYNQIFYDKKTWKNSPHARMVRKNIG